MLRSPAARSSRGPHVPDGGLHCPPGPAARQAACSRIDGLPAVCGRYRSSRKKIFAGLFRSLISAALGIASSACTALLSFRRRALSRWQSAGVGGGPRCPAPAESPGCRSLGHSIRRLSLGSPRQPRELRTVRSAQCPAPRRPLLGPRPSPLLPGPCGSGRLAPQSRSQAPGPASRALDAEAFFSSLGVHPRACVAPGGTTRPDASRPPPRPTSLFPRLQFSASTPKEPFLATPSRPDEAPRGPFSLCPWRFSQYGLSRRAVSCLRAGTRLSLPLCVPGTWRLVSWGSASPESLSQGPLALPPCRRRLVPPGDAQGDAGNGTRSSRLQFALLTASRQPRCLFNRVSVPYRWMMKMKTFSEQKSNHNSL